MKISSFQQNKWKTYKSIKLYYYFINKRIITLVLSEIRISILQVEPDLFNNTWDFWPLLLKKELADTLEHPVLDVSNNQASFESALDSVVLSGVDVGWEVLHVSDPLKILRLPDPANGTFSHGLLDLGRCLLEGVVPFVMIFHMVRLVQRANQLGSLDWLVILPHYEFIFLAYISDEAFHVLFEFGVLAFVVFSDES